MKILCVCEGGNTRSVTLATLLKYNYGNHDAIAMSQGKNKGDTLRMLANWANLILAADSEIYTKLLQDLLAQKDGNERKVELADLGTDKWGMSMHPDLIPLATRVLENLGFQTSKTLDEILTRRAKYTG
jgi:hypothetical protein